MLEGRLLELRLVLPHAEAVREGREDLERLARDLRALPRGHEPQRPHVVEPVRELDDHNAPVLGHGDEHGPHVLDLLLLRVRGGQIARHLRQLRHLGLALDDAPHVDAEHGLDLPKGQVRVLDGVVEEARDDGVAVHVRPREDLRDLDGVGHEGLAGPPLLAPVGEERDLDGVAHGLAAARAEVLGFALERVRVRRHLRGVVDSAGRERRREGRAVGLDVRRVEELGPLDRGAEARRRSQVGVRSPVGKRFRGRARARDPGLRQGRDEGDGPEHGGSQRGRGAA
mmetsp:Transcript_8390/g.27437  ORF Transcript_8390/g.27437 Transcript_8390/m.27437 type:complete len:284 (+) Transcript_8390:1445-2296(+)